MGFSRQEYWSGLPFPSPGDLSRPRDRTRVSHIVGRCSTVWATREVHKRVKHLLYDNLIKALSNRSTDRDFSPCTTISNTNTYNMDKETNAVNNSIPYGDTCRDYVNAVWARSWDKWLKRIIMWILPAACRGEHSYYARLVRWLCMAVRALNDAFELWYWRRLLRVSWTAGK